MAQRKLDWTADENGLNVTFKSTGLVHSFLWADIRGWDERTEIGVSIQTDDDGEQVEVEEEVVIPASVPRTGLAFEGMRHGLKQRLADSIAGNDGTDQDKLNVMTSLWASMTKQDSISTRKPKTAKVDVTSLLAKAAEMNFDADQMETLMSLIGQAQTSK